MQAIEETLWYVPSISGISFEGYRVKQLIEICVPCTSKPSLLCTQNECGFLCYHMYSCAKHCYDYTNGHICKHIHRVHSVKRKTVNPTVNASNAVLSGDEVDYEPEELQLEIKAPLNYAERDRDIMSGMYCICYNVPSLNTQLFVHNRTDHKT